LPRDCRIVVMHRSDSSALELFAPDEYAALDDSAKILPIRQEQLKERLGERFRVLDAESIDEVFQ